MSKDAEEKTERNMRSDSSSTVQETNNVMDEDEDEIYFPPDKANEHQPVDTQMDQESEVKDPSVPRINDED